MKRDLKEIFKSLEGNWKLERKVFDVAEGIINHARGNALFTFRETKLKDTLYYEEEGILSVSRAAKELNFRRKYIYKYIEDRIEVYLDDGVTKGKLFQQLSNNDDSCSFVGSEHICREDKHNGKYYFENEKRFETEYLIKGQNKEIEIRTIYYKK